MILAKMASAIFHSIDIIGYNMIKCDKVLYSNVLGEMQ